MISVLPILCGERRSWRTRQNARDTHPEMFAEYDHFTLGETAIPDIDVDGFTREAIELNDGTTTKPENFLHGHGSATEFNGNGQRQIEQHRHGDFGRAKHGVFEVRQLRRARGASAVARTFG